jgi:siroheme synthase
MRPDTDPTDRSQALAALRGKYPIFAGGEVWLVGAEDEDGVDWTAIARTRQPIVLYMGLRNLESIANQLMHGGLAADTAAAVISSATLAEERVLVSTLDGIAADAHAAQFAAPAIVVIGDVVHTRQRLLDMAAQFGKPVCES